MPGGMRSPVAPASPAFPPPEAVYLSPEDEGRRFPLFTRYQLILIGLGLGLLIFLLVVAFLVWRQERRDQMRAESARGHRHAPARPRDAAAGPGAESELDADRRRGARRRRQGGAHSRYNRSASCATSSRSRTARDAPGGRRERSREGRRENVIKPVAGVRGVINLLIVKTGGAAGRSSSTRPKWRLEEALRRRLRVGAGERRGAARARGGGGAACLRAARARTGGGSTARGGRRAAPVGRGPAAARGGRVRAPPGRDPPRRGRPARPRRAGAARGQRSARRHDRLERDRQRDRRDHPHRRGASVRHLEGEPPRQTKATFSAPMPRAPDGPAPLGQRAARPASSRSPRRPTATTIIRIDDSDKGGDKRYDFALRWEAQ